MKRSVFGRRNALLGRGLSRAGIALVAVVAVVLVFRVVFPGMLALALAPLSYISGGALSGIASIGSVVTGPAKLATDLQAARSYSAELEAQNQVLAARARDLEKLLGTRLEAKEGTLAGVLARPPQSPYDALVIDQGSDAGVGVGALATGAGGIPLGRVQSVTRGSARVLLFTAPGLITEGWVGESRTPISLVGEGGGTLSATAPREALIAVGDMVYVPGPGALPIARVVRVDTDPADPAAIIRIQPLVNPFTLTWVNVLPVSVLPE